MFTVDGEAILGAPQVREGSTVAHLDACQGPDRQVSFLECNPPDLGRGRYSYGCGASRGRWTYNRRGLAQGCADPVLLLRRSSTAPRGESFRPDLPDAVVADDFLADRSRGRRVDRWRERVPAAGG